MDGLHMHRIRHEKGSERDGFAVVKGARLPFTITLEGISC